uniref:PGG domain-containing protein n=1 Tax=Oryza punctata TaxID=4537 RepID=A0A0E0M022_ORYPU
MDHGADQFAERIEQALKDAAELGDADLQAALRRAKELPHDTAFQLPLLPPRAQPPVHAGAAATQPDQQNADRRLMCPELYRAAFSGSADKLQELLVSPSGTAAVADQQGRRHDGQCVLDETTAGLNTVLHIAAGQGKIGLVRKLCDGDDTATAAVAALLPKETTRLETALHHAARAGRRDMVSLLLRLAQTHGSGAPGLLVTKNSAGDTALHVAARHGRVAVVKALMVAAPALSCGVNNAGMSPLYLAVVGRSLGAVKAIIQWKHASSSGPKKQNALHAAVLQSVEFREAKLFPRKCCTSDNFQSYIELTRDLLSWNPNLAKERDESESTPLHYAASDGVREIVNVFFQSMPSAMYIPDKDGLTPLHVAAKMGHLDVIQDMLKACPDSAELVDKEGRNILHLAVERGHESVVTYILGNPSLAELVNEQDKKGDTPLHYAVRAGNPRLAILESEHIKLNIVNNEGQTPFDLSSNTTGFLHMIGFVLRLSANGARFGAQRQDCIAQRSSKKVKEWNEKTSKNLGIVAVLIATIALTAMFNVPGGYNSDGVANLRATTAYNAFLVLDTVAMASSVIATMLLTYGRGAGRSSTAWICMSLIFLWMALMSMILAFMAAVVSGLDSTTTKYILWSIFVLPFAFLVALSFVWAVPAPTFTTLLLLPRAFAGEDSGWTRRRVGRRFPSVGIYLLVLYLFWFLNAVAFFLTVYVVVNTT